MPELGFAQQYSIDWYKIAGGGGISTNGPYSITGTIGQPDAGVAMSGSSYSLTSGFWSLISVVQTAGAPLLAISYTSNQAIISWSPSIAGWTLQTNNNLTTGAGGIPRTRNQTPPSRCQAFSVRFS